MFDQLAGSSHGVKDIMYDPHIFLLYQKVYAKNNNKAL